MIISLAEGHGCSSKNDISKEIPPKACGGLILRIQGFEASGVRVKGIKREY